MAPAVKFVDISCFVKIGQLFIKMFIYAKKISALARKSISTNINLAVAGQKVNSNINENTTEKSTINHHKVIISF